MSKTGRKLQYNIEYGLLDYIQSKLDEKYSPDVISGELRHVHVQAGEDRHGPLDRVGNVVEL